MDKLFRNTVDLNKPLVIPEEKFNKGYDYPIEQLVETRPGGRDEIKYMSYTHAIRIMKELFPELNAECVLNPLTGSYLFEEENGRGYFMLAYVHDGERCSSIFYYGILDTSMAPILQEQAATYRDKRAGGALKAKTFINLRGEEEVMPALTSQVINKAYYRALCKAIAFSTGIGLKLWTGEDLTDIVEEVPVAPVMPDRKRMMIEAIHKMAAEYTQLTGVTYDYTLNTDDEESLKVLGKRLKELVAEAKAPVPATPPPQELAVDESANESTALDIENIEVSVDTPSTEEAPRRGRRSRTV